MRYNITLAYCNGWTERVSYGQVRMNIAAGRKEVSPDAVYPMQCGIARGGGLLLPLRKETDPDRQTASSQKAPRPRNHHKAIWEKAESILGKTPGRLLRKNDRTDIPGLLPYLQSCRGSPCEGHVCAASGTEEGENGYSAGSLRSLYR